MQDELGILKKINRDREKVEDILMGRKYQNSLSSFRERQLAVIAHRWMSVCHLMHERMGNLNETIELLTDCITNPPKKEEKPEPFSTDIEYKNGDYRSGKIGGSDDRL